MARQAQAGFVAGPDFPVFAPLPERKASKAKKVVMGMQCLLAVAFIVLGCCAAKIVENKNRLERLKAWLPFTVSECTGR